DGVSDLSILDRTRRDAALTRPHRESAAGCLQFFLIPTVMGCEMNQRPVEAEDTATHRAAKDRRSLGNGVESRLQIRWGRRDDPKDLCRSRLFFERVPGFGNEARIFDRQHRLSGKALQQPKLLIG